MVEVRNLLEEEIKKFAGKFLDSIEKKEIQIISHFDTDGITSAVIMLKTLNKLDKRFSIKIIKSLEKDFIYNLSKEKVTLFLDLASNSLNAISESGIKDIFIVDHHEISQPIPEGINIINPELNGKEKLSSSCLTYLLCKNMGFNDKKTARLAILGMIGDTLDKEIDKLNHIILEEGEIKRKRGLLIYPATRPLNRVLEFCSNPYIPEVTGDTKGVQELLREISLFPENGKYKSLMELNEEEMQKLTTSIMLRNPKIKNNEIIGDIYLIKLFNKLEDARELSAIVNACSRSGETGIAMQLCMEIPSAKKKAESIHARYKQLLVSGLKFVEKTEKIKGKGFILINAKEKINDTMIGTITSIISKSAIYEEGTIIITMAYYENKIKISGRIVKKGRNVREMLYNVINNLGEGEVGGHECAAGCIIKREQEQKFIDLLKKNLEIEVVKYH